MVTSPWESELARELKTRFPDDVLECSSYLEQNFAVVRPAATGQILAWLRNERGFDMIVDLTAVHYPKRPEAQLELIYIVYCHERNERLRIKTTIPEGYEPTTAVTVYPGANWLEREVYDMFGIRFAGHPDLRRILLPEDWQGFPLRKDMSILAMDNQWVQNNLGIESGQ
jgi:NADH-quinone oxidoreductase subunit C